MTRTVRYPLALLAAFIWLVAGAGLARGEDVLTFPGGLTANVVRNAPTVADFPAALGTGVTATEVTVVPVSVRRDGYSSEGLTNGLKAEWVPEVPALRLTLDDPVPQPGSYVVTVRIRTAKASQFATFTLTRANAEVTVPSAVTVTRDEPVFGHGGSEGKPILNLRCSRDDKLTAVTMWQAEADSGSVVADPVDLSSCTNGASVIHYHLEGDFPLGPSVRTLTIASPQLTTPKTVAFTIQNRRPTWLIPGLVVLGIVVGWGSRKLLVPAIAKVRSQTVLREAIERVEAARDAAKDTDYVADLDKALAVNEGAVGSATPEQIEAQAAALLKAADEAQKALVARLKAVTESVTELADHVDRPLKLPEASANARVEASAALGKVRAAIKDENAVAAVQDLTAATESVRAFDAAVHSDLLALHGTLAPVLRIFGPEATGDAGTVRVLAGRVETALDTDVTDRDRVEQLSELSLLAGTLVEATQRILSQAIGMLQRKYAQAADTLTTVRGQAPEPTTATLSMAARWAAEAVSSLESTLCGLGPGFQDEIKAALAVGDIAAAVRRVEGADLGPDEPPAPDLQPEPTATTGADRPTTETGLVPVPGGFGTVPPTLPILRLRAGLLTWVQTILLGLVLIVVSLALYEKDWVGSWTQMVAVLTWAAALDLTTAAVLGAAKPTAPAT